MAIVLVVDDSENARHDLVRLLKKHDHTTHEAENGLEALELAKKLDHIDLIITDLNMPEMDGVDLCETLFNEKIHPNAHIIMVTTESSIELKKELKQYGVMAWATKPYREDFLIKGIGQLLKSTKPRV